MSYIVKQKRGNSIYVYRATSYWDKEKNQPRQKREYLGRIDTVTGEFIKSTGIKGKKAMSMMPKSSKDYGNIYLLDKISEKIGLKEILKEIYPYRWNSILSLAFFAVSENSPFYLFEQWKSHTYIKGLKNISSQSISKLLKELGSMDRLQLDFSINWCIKKGDTSALIFDITSVSSYSELMELVQWGYNRDKEHLPQINIGMVFGEPSSLPLFYSVYPGSIPDIVTLKNIVLRLNKFHIKTHLFILDRGFYSRSNIELLNNNNISFLMPISFSTNISKSIIEKHKSTISSPLNSFLINGKVVYGEEDSIEIPIEECKENNKEKRRKESRCKAKNCKEENNKGKGKSKKEDSNNKGGNDSSNSNGNETNNEEHNSTNIIKLKAFIYYDEERESIEKQRFMKHLLEVEDEVYLRHREKPFKSIDEVKEWMDRKSKEFGISNISRYFDVQIKQIEAKGIKEEKREIRREGKEANSNESNKNNEDKGRKYKEINHNNNNISLKLVKNERLILDKLSKSGMTVLITNDDTLNKEKALSLYRRRNNVEMTFNVLKNRLDGGRLRTHSTDAASGKLFLLFIALILYSALDKLMRDKEVYNKYTISELLEMLKNIRIVKLQSGPTYLTEVPKKAKDIFKLFGLEPLDSP